MNLILIDFKSKQCKELQHKNCSNRWNGLGFDVICNCNCHKKEMLDEKRSLSNITNSPSVKSGEYV